jgi:hypothetical protein
MWTQNRSPEQQLALVLGGTGIRMLVVLGLGVGAYYLIPGFSEMSFWTWLLAFYLVTLTLDVVLLARRLR